MHLLKDVDITVPPEDGDVYIYDGNKNKFVTFNLNSFVTDVNQRITNLNTRVNNLAGAVNTLTNKINDIESIIPFWPADKTTKLARGDINLISDPSNTNNKAHGLFTHDKNTDKYADEYFS
jgi:hypothetical protein